MLTSRAGVGFKGLVNRVLALIKMVTVMGFCLQRGPESTNGSCWWKIQESRLHLYVRKSSFEYSL